MHLCHRARSTARAASALDRARRGKVQDACALLAMEASSAPHEFTHGHGLAVCGVPTRVDGQAAADVAREAGGLGSRLARSTERAAPGLRPSPHQLYSGGALATQASGSDASGIRSAPSGGDGACLEALASLVQHRARLDEARAVLGRGPVVRRRRAQPQPCWHRTIPPPHTHTGRTQRGVDRLWHRTTTDAACTSQRAGFKRPSLRGSPGSRSRRSRGAERERALTAPRVTPSGSEM